MTLTYIRGIGPRRCVRISTAIGYEEAGMKNRQFTDDFIVGKLVVLSPRRRRARGQHDRVGFLIWEVWVLKNYGTKQ